MEQDLLSTLDYGLVPFLLLLGRGEGNRREQDHLPTLACRLVHCLLLQGREGRREGGRERERERRGRVGRQRGILPTSICMSSSKKLLH